VDSEGEGSIGAASFAVSSDFRDLVAYRLAVAVADDMHGAAARWDSFERWSLGIQLVRAADSVGANIAEAMGRWHAPDRRRLLFIARGSLYETEHWILRAESRGLLEPKTNDRLGEVARALNGLIRSPTGSRP
jgi:four helix bundle protein